MMDTNLLRYQSSEKWVKHVVLTLLLKPLCVEYLYINGGPWGTKVANFQILHTVDLSKIFSVQFKWFQMNTSLMYHI